MTTSVHTPFVLVADHDEDTRAMLPERFKMHHIAAAECAAVNLDEILRLLQPDLPVAPEGDC